MKLAIVSDEIHHDFEQAVQYGTEMGIFRFELRSLWGSRFPLLSHEQVQRIKDIRKGYGIEISAVSPGLFKTSLYSEEMALHRTSLLERTLETAAELEVPRIIIFGVQRCPQDKAEDGQQVKDILGEASLRAGRSGFTMLLENEPGWWADTSPNISSILHELEDTGLGLNWDVGNLFNAGEEDFRPGYGLLKKYIANVHMKDVKKTSQEHHFVPMGEGDIDWPGQLKALKEDGYSHHIVIETHCTPLLDASRKSADYVKRLLQA